MKKIALLFVLLFAASCSCKKNTPALRISLSSECPNDGDCKIEVAEAKSMNVKTSDNGSLYYELEDNTSKKVVKYTYNRKVKGDLQDATYREEIVFELPAFEDEITLNNESLQDVKLLFGRFCYCKGQTGYYSIDQGLMRAVKSKEPAITNITLDFKTEKVPQVITQLAFSIQ